MMSETNFIKIKFKGVVYDDGVKDSFGHIRFGSNVYEYVPADSLSKSPHVIIHGYRPTATGYTHTSKKSTAKVKIIEEA